MNTSSGLDYTVINSNSVVVCGIGSCADEHIVIPSAVRGYTVVGIAEKAFLRSSQIKSVTLPKSVKFIDQQAFAWCRELIEVKIAAVTEICDKAFIGCDKLEAVNFGKSLEYIGKKAFAFCPSITVADLPDTVYRLSSASFEGCRSLSRIYIPESVKIIESSTFYACEKLRKVTLPSKLEYIDEFAFAYCISIVEMNISQRTVINSGAFFECGKICENGRVS